MARGVKSPVVPLTADQQELVVAHMRLVQFVVSLKKSRFFVGLYQDEADAIAQGYVGLCKAAAKHDPARARFSTYACLCIYTALKSGVESLVGKPKHWTNYCIHKNGPELMERTLIDYRSGADPAELKWDKDAAAVAVSHMSPRQRRIAKAYLKLGTMGRVAKKVGVSRARIQQLLRNSGRQLIARGVQI